MAYLITCSDEAQIIVVDGGVVGQKLGQLWKWREQCSPLAQRALQGLGIPAVLPSRRVRHAWNTGGYSNRVLGYANLATHDPISSVPARGLTLIVQREANGAIEPSGCPISHYRELSAREADRLLRL